MCWVRHATSAPLPMHLHVDSNLALEIPPDSGRDVPASKADPRADLAAQFIPSGARVLDLSGSAALERLLPNGCSYSGIARVGGKRPALVCDLNAGNFPTDAAAQSDIIVLLGALQQIVDVENLFTHLRFCKR